MVVDSIVSERNAAALAIGCVVGTLDFSNHKLFHEDERNEKRVKTTELFFSFFYNAHVSYDLAGILN